MANNEMTINDLASKLDAFIVHVDGRLTKLEEQMQEIKTEVRVNATKIDMLQHYQTNGFTVLAGVITLGCCVIGLAPMFRDMFKERRNRNGDEHTRALIREEFARLNTNNTN